jgi:hypothetical protein
LVDHPWQGTLIVTIGKPDLVERESGYFENHQQHSQKGDQLVDPSLETQHLALQLGGVHVERAERHDFDARGG